MTSSAEFPRRRPVKWIGETTSYEPIAPTVQEEMF
jgi:hypothetical protein